MPFKKRKAKLKYFAEYYREAYQSDAEFRASEAQRKKEWYEAMMSDDAKAEAKRARERAYYHARKKRKAA